jgi:transcription initiation factor IIE alpha subunit
MSAVFKGLLDLRRSSTKPAAVVLLDSVQTDDTLRHIDLPSRADGRSEMFVCLQSCYNEHFDTANHIQTNIRLCGKDR